MDKKSIKIKNKLPKPKKPNRQNKIFDKKQVKRYFDETSEKSNIFNDRKVGEDVDRDRGKISLINDSNKFDGKIIKVVKFEKPFQPFRKHFDIKNNFHEQKNNEKFKKRYKPKIDPKLIKKHSRGVKSDESGIKTNFFKEKLKKKEIYLNYAVEQAARAEILLTEEQGFLEADKGELTYDYRQEEIVKNVDITAATKNFKLHLDFGPYHHRYTKNGRHLLLGGRRGHVAAFDWVTKKIHCEINVMEEVADVSWLHLETMFACAQKNYTYFYDNTGIELHCVKSLYSINKLEFLPYHFLLATASSKGYLSWLDITLGELVGHHNTKLGDIRIMRQNPSNGVLCIGGGQGVVSMWTPKVRDPVAKIICHATPMTSLAIDPKGLHLVTGGLDKRVKVWDIRNLEGPLAIYNLRLPANEIEISQKGVLAFAMGNFCQIYANTLIEDKAKPYLRQTVDDFIHTLRFCPYEDVLGVSSGKGFTSLLVPGSGEPNFDAYEANPFQTKSQRKENEVKAILEKIPAEFITLDQNEIAGVDVESLKIKVESKKETFFLKPPQIDFKSRRKMKGKGGSVKAARNKQIVKDMKRKEFINEIKQNKKEFIQEFAVEDTKTEVSSDFIPLEMPKTSVLDRFKPKKKNSKL